MMIETGRDLEHAIGDMELPLYFRTTHGTFQFVAHSVEQEIERDGETVNMVVLQEVEKP